jgi:hypothetical protein
LWRDFSFCQLASWREKERVAMGCDWSKEMRENSGVRMERKELKEGIKRPDPGAVSSALSRQNGLQLPTSQCNLKTH